MDSASLLLIEQQMIHNLLAVAKIRTLEPIEGIGEIHQAPPCSQSEDAKRTGNFKPFVERYMGPFTLVD